MGTLTLLVGLTLAPLLVLALISALLLARRKTRASFISSSIGWGALIATIGMTVHYAFLIGGLDTHSPAWGVGKFLALVPGMVLFETMPVAFDLMVFGVSITLATRLIARRFAKA